MLAVHRQEARKTSCYNSESAVLWFTKIPYRPETAPGRSLLTRGYSLAVGRRTQNASVHRVPEDRG